MTPEAIRDWAAEVRSERDGQHTAALLDEIADEITALTARLEALVPATASVDFDEEDGSLSFTFYSAKGLIVASGHLFRSQKAFAHILHNKHEDRLDLNAEEGWLRAALTPPATETKE